MEIYYSMRESDTRQLLSTKTVYTYGPLDNKTSGKLHLLYWRRSPRPLFRRREVSSYRYMSVPWGLCGWKFLVRKKHSSHIKGLILVTWTRSRTWVVNFTNSLSRPSIIKIVSTTRRRQKGERNGWNG